MPTLGRPATPASRPRNLKRLDRDNPAREPQVALHDRSRDIDRAVRGITRRVQRPQLCHPGPQHQGGLLPPDPLSDHRGGRRGELGQQRPDPRLVGVDQRGHRTPLIPRRLISRQRRTDRVPRQPRLLHDRLDAHLLRPIQPSDLSLVLSHDHSLTVPRGSGFTRQRQEDVRVAIPLRDGGLDSCSRRRAAERAPVGGSTTGTRGSPSASCWLVMGRGGESACLHRRCENASAIPCAYQRR